MRDEEYQLLDEIVRSEKPHDTLEIGMAHGGSTVVICRALHRLGRGRHVAIDPFQTSDEWWRGTGLARVAANGLDAHLELIEEFDHLALPRLLHDGRRFDLILVDGWHSFDHTMLDFFYADLLLRIGGVVMFHDTCLPSVHRVCRFIETHKPYDPIGPPPIAFAPWPTVRAWRRMMRLATARPTTADIRLRRTRWFTLAAYRKRADRLVPDLFHADF